ncbi:MAG: hypothetical protein ABSB66_07550 [Candidatus Acidiferrales bacterium]|jgi:hypothetical protein
MIIDALLAEAANRSIEELELERDTMLIELLATRAKGEKSALTATPDAAKTARTK